MIQQARSINSQSLLRELEYCILLLDDQEKVDYFQKLFDEVVEKRKDDETHYTGAKAVRQELLACLRQLGEVKTANIWARNLVIDFDNIQDLREQIADKLIENSIYGIVEIHLQDREINSSHIQFTGTQAELAEYLIAEILVENRYELSIESAIGKSDFVRAYETQNVPRTANLADELEHEAKKREVQNIQIGEDDWFANYQKKMDSLKANFWDTLNASMAKFEYKPEKKRESMLEKRLNKEQLRYEINNKPIDELMDDLQQERAKITRRRR